MNEAIAAAAETVSGRVPRRLAAGQSLFLVVLMLYLLFPTEDGIKALAIGVEGSRLLLLDLFVALLMLLTFPFYRQAARKVRGLTGVMPWILFLGTACFSLVRGLPVHGGYALGEARWFACSLLVPVGFVLASREFVRKVAQVILLAATFQAIGAIVQITGGRPMQEADSVMRFAGGRQALVIAFGVLVLIRRRFDSDRLTAWWDKFLFLFYLGTLLAIQTRSLFLFLPVVIVFYSMFRLGLTWESVKKFGKMTVLVGGGLLLVYHYLLPLQIQRSVQASVEVVTESVSPATVQFILDPDQLAGPVAEQYSRAGNAAFRIMAWSQVLRAIEEAPGGWLVGMPMGSGFEFSEPSGYVYENLEPHNDYLSILSKTGIIGLCGYFMLLIRSFLPLIRRKNGDVRLTASPEAIFLLSIVLLLSLFGSLNAEMRTYGTHFWLWPFLGMALQGFREVGRSTRAAEPHHH